MSYTDYISNCIAFCRICLNKSSNMSLFQDKYNSSNDSPTIMEVLEKDLGKKINPDTRYPHNVCRTCINSLKCSIDIKDIFHHSQNILDKYIHVKPKALETIRAAEQSEDISNNEIAELSKRKHQFRGEKKFWLRCQYCSQTFKTKELLKSHSTNCKEITKVDYDYCDKMMVSGEILKSHLISKHNKEIIIKPDEFKCDQCNEVFNSANSLSYHKSTRHYSKRETHSCEVCQKSFMLPKSLRQHMNIHTKDVSKIVCPICGKIFHYSGYLFYHMKIHTSDQNYVCDICDNNFLNMSALMKHQSTHTNKRPYVCTFCPNTFSTKRAVIAHEKRHSRDKSHPCKYCDKKFTTPWASRLHMSSHPGPYQCEKCLKGLLNEDVMKLHYRFKHNLTVEVNLETDH